MSGLKGILESFEKLIYDVMLWVIFVPKTLHKVITNPGWAPDYVAKELSEDESTRFDDYISPLILMLLASLIPFAIYMALPMPGATINGPTTGKVGEVYTFTSQANFILSEDAEYSSDWIVSRSEGPDETITSEVIPIANLFDSMEASWAEPGYHIVSTTVDNGIGETYFWDHYIEILGDGERLLPNKKVDKPKEPENLFDKVKTQLEGENAVLAAFGFLILPFIFSLAMEMFRGRAITGSLLKVSLYIQCFYCAPPMLLFWSLLIFGSYFNTLKNDNILGYLTLLFLTMLGWFVVNEIKVIAKMRDIGKLKSTGIFVFVFIMIIGGVIGLGIALEYPDSFSDFIWKCFAFFIAFTFVAGLISKWRRRSTNKEKPAAEEKA